jgi:excisionase family DNA binding protein
MEVSQLLGSSSDMVMRAIAGGELKASKEGSGYRVSRSELEAFWVRRGGGKLFETNTVKGENQ